MRSPFYLPNIFLGTGGATWSRAVTLAHTSMMQTYTHTAARGRRPDTCRLVPMRDGAPCLPACLLVSINFRTKSSGLNWGLKPSAAPLSTCTCTDIVRLFFCCVHTAVSFTDHASRRVASAFTAPAEGSVLSYLSFLTDN
eukprot:3107697-Prymnesium_polylepis.2